MSALGVARSDESGDLRLRRHLLVGRRACVLSGCRSAGLHPLRPQHRDSRSARRLTEDLRSCVARAEAPVLIDQEGGRVARLRPPHWRKAPPARLLGELYARDPERGLEATKLNSRLLAADVASIGCDVDCLPVLDIAFPETHAVIGDRAYASQPEPVAALGRAAAEGLLAEGVMPVIKHIPGHGRAMVDSHHALPRVSASRDDPGAHRFRALQVPGRPAVGDDGARALRGDRSGCRPHGFGTGREGYRPRPYRLRRPAFVGRPLDAGAGRHPRRAGGARAGGRLRHCPALQRPDGGNARGRCKCRCR